MDYYKKIYTLLAGVGPIARVLHFYCINEIFVLPKIEIINYSFFKWLAYSSFKIPPY